jgi:hypothetical protein
MTSATEGKLRGIAGLIRAASTLLDELLDERQTLVREAHDAGATRPALAKASGLSLSRIHQILDKDRGPKAASKSA